MEKLDRHKLLVKFLKRNGVLREFIENVWEERKSFSEKKYKTPMEAFLSINDISTAFVWGVTREGAYFWKDLSSRFDNLQKEMFLS